MYDDDCQESHKFKNSIGGVMVGVLAWSGVDREIKRWSGQTEDYRIGICFFSAKHAVLSSKSKTGLLWISIMCQNGMTCLAADCFS